jgi:hypothetical protein
LTFDARDVDLRNAPHIGAMVINCSVVGWDLHKVLVDNGSQADIIFLHAFDRMGISHSLLKPSDNPLYGFGGKGTFPVGKIELPLSFGVAPNARSEQVTFDIVDMVYPYNAIMGRGSINKFEAAIHGLYLCMKIPGPQGAITVYGNQQAARNIERDFVPGQRNIHCLTAQREVPESASPTAKEHDKAQLQSNNGTKTVPLDKATPKQTVTISEDLTSHNEERLLCCLSKNKDVFAWSTLDLVGVSRSIIEHSLGIDPSLRPKKQRLRKMSDEKIEATKAEVHRLLEAKFIEPIAYHTWLANVVMVQKKSGKWRMCIDFTNLNKACPKDNFPLPRIDKIVDSAAGCEVMSLLDCFSGYHQIYMKGGGQGEHQLHNTLRHVLLHQNAGGTQERRVHFLSAHQNGARGPSRQKYIHVCGRHRRGQQKQGRPSGRPRRNICEHAGRTASPEPRKVRLRCSPGENLGLPGVTLRD